MKGDAAIEAQVRVLAAVARARGDSPGRCESCGWIITYGEPYGECPDTEALTCQNCVAARSTEGEGSDG